MKRSLVRIRPLWEGLTYFDHQLKGIRKMLQLERTGTPFPALGDHDEGIAYGGFQCDDMGLGKTIQTLATMAHNPKPLTLILCPLALIDNWTENAAKAGFKVFVKSDEDGDWMPFDCESHLDAAVPASEPGSDAGMPPRKRSSLGGVYVANYDSVLHRESMLMLAWDRIVLDEAHVIRNHKGIKSRKICALAEDVAIKWAVTGTPIVNRFKDASTLFSFVGVPTLGKQTWLSSYYEPLISEMCIHRSMDEIRAVLSSCPPVPIIEHRVVPFKNVAEASFYRHLQDLQVKLRFAYEKGDSAMVLTLLLRLRQSSVTPQILMPDWDESSGKMDALAEMVEEEPSSKFLVFCSFHDEMDILKDFLGEGVELYHGGMNEAERRSTLKRAKKPSCRVLLMQINCGGCGLNLQEFDRVVFMSPWWTSALMDQAIARAVRMGQKKTVRVVHLMIEEESSMNIDSFTTEKDEMKREFLKVFFQHRCVL